MCLDLTFYLGSTLSFFFLLRESRDPPLPFSLLLCHLQIPHKRVLVSAGPILSRNVLPLQIQVGWHILQLET